MVDELKIEIRISGQLVEAAELRPPGPYSIGRSPDCDVVVSDLRVSRRWGMVHGDGDRWWYRAMARTDDTAEPGELPIDAEAPCVVSLSDDGSVQVVFMPPTNDPDAAIVELPEPRPSTPVIDGGTVLQRIGRSPESDLVIEELIVSRHHAEVRSSGDQIILVDVNSHLGTFVDGVRITKGAALSPGSRVTIGSRMLQFDGRRLVESVEAAAALLHIDYNVLREGALACPIRHGLFPAVTFLPPSPSLAWLPSSPPRRFSWPPARFP